MVVKKTPIRLSVSNSRPGGGGCKSKFFPARTHRAKHTLGRGGHFICRRGVSYNGKNTKFTIKRFPPKPGGHFLKARRAFFCPRAAGVRNTDLGLYQIAFSLKMLNKFHLNNNYM